MKKGASIMKYLEIKEGKGFFADYVNNEWQFKDILLITKDNILRIFDGIVSDSNVSFDENVNSIQNPASQIIYNSLLAKFKELQPKIKADIEKINADFEESLKKYS